MNQETNQLSGRRARRIATAVFIGTALAMPLLPLSAPPLNAAPVVANELPGSFADLVERVSPAVVSIVTTQPVAARPDMPELPPGLAPFFRDFGFPGMPAPDTPAPDTPSREATAMGSGFIIDPEGYVVTNNHVIAEASSVSVVLEDGTKLDATVVGRDDKVDLALLKVDAETELPHLAFGDSDGVRVGDWTIAVGNPFGLGGTVTAGIVSARGRDINSGPYDDYLQLDASINRGNSGGPTFDIEGNVIGVNTAIFSPNGGNVGIGFAIPSNLAEPIVAQLKEQGFVSRGWFGVQIQQVTPAIAESLDLADEAGALVADVTPDSPAHEAGIEVGDVIVAFAGEPVEDVRELTRKVAMTEVGEPQPLVVWRRGEQVQLTIEVEQAPDRTMAAAPNEVEPSVVLGLQLAQLDAETRQQSGLGPKDDGVLVVGAEGAAAETVRPGDVILSIDNEPVAAPRDVVDLVEAAEAEDHAAILLLVNRQGDQLFTTIDIRLA